MKHINSVLAIQKKLIYNDDMSLYNKLRIKYQYVLEYYLSTIIDLKKYEQEIDNSNLYIGKNIKYKVLNKYLDLDYLFLINNLFIEKLNENDINLLQNFNENNISNDLLNMVERTFKEIIKDNYLNNEYQDKIYKICYGPVVPSNFVDNDALVFKLYYGKNIKEILDTDKFLEINQKQISFINDIINKIKKEIKEKLNVNCEILLEKDIY